MYAFFQRVKVVKKTVETKVMNRLLAIMLLFCLSLHITDAKAESSNQGVKVIVIDAGHGGEDPGAIGVSGIFEKDLNLAIAYEVGNILEEHGFAVLYTRTEDKLLYTEAENIKGLRKISDLKNRCKIAAEYSKGRDLM